MERQLMHDLERAASEQPVNRTPRVQGPVRARASIQVRCGDSVLCKPDSILAALETSDHPAGTVIVDRGEVVASWELKCVAAGGKRIGGWVLVGQQTQRVA